MSRKWIRNRTEILHKKKHSKKINIRTDNHIIMNNQEKMS